MNIAITIIEIKIKEWKIKRIMAIERQQELENEGKKLQAIAYHYLIDSIQETLSDLTEMIDQINNISAYEKSCIDLINNQINK
tara:strand:+ start:242 stop:490 length:249 start_codon:yes stop_codon:yes gene_type:complete